MYYSKFYKKIDPSKPFDSAASNAAAAQGRSLDMDKIVEDIRKEGFNPIEIFDQPDFVYEPHQHKQDNLLIFLEGEMTLTVGGEKHVCKPGDTLLIPANTIHFGKVGNKGCHYFWSQKAM